MGDSVAAGATGSFEQVFRRAFKGAAGLERGPYRYQERIAEDGLPEVLEVPTGAGKTAAVVMAWLWRRRLHPDPEVRAATPRRLVLAFPMRVLVTQTRKRVREWINDLGLDDVGVHVLMGGEPREDDWRRKPAADGVLIGTIDMLLSRALNRGYGESRFTWPVSFGLLNADTHWVFDEVQLMGAALPTSRQLQAFRDQMGTALPTSSTWMSATIDPQALRTVDNGDTASWLSLTDEDRNDPNLRPRLRASKTVRRVEGAGGDRDPDRHASLMASTALRIHGEAVASGSDRKSLRTIVVCNTVRTAQGVFRKLRSDPQAPEQAPEVVLLHSRFRPDDRQSATDRALEDRDRAGRIVVATQAIEAGVDISSARMLTEACPWPSLVQRAGRCNRAREHQGNAELWWVPPHDPAPYPGEDVKAAQAALESLEGQEVTAETLAGVDCPTTPRLHATLRRGDLLDLFDTAQNLTGAEVDVSRFVRDIEDVDVAVAWSDTSPTAKGDKPAVRALPGRGERCPAPIGQVKDLLGAKGRGSGRAWRYDHLAKNWIPARAADIRPGMVLILHADVGGYDPDLGWDPKSRGPVLPVHDEEPAAEDAHTALGDDPLTLTGQWVGLGQHLADAGHTARGFVDELLGRVAPGAAGDFLVAHGDALVRAAELHDLGKAHAVFQETLREAAKDVGSTPDRPATWAKSPGDPAKFRHKRRGFRHELVSLLLLDAHPHLLAGVAEHHDLVCYLVAAHHGRVRLSARSNADELASATGDRGVEWRPLLLGVQDGDTVGETRLRDTSVPETTLRLDALRLGEREHGKPSWTARALALRDDPALGPFRLGFAEAMVRVADWLASADPYCAGHVEAPDAGGADADDSQPQAGGAVR